VLEVDHFRPLPIEDLRKSPFCRQVAEGRQKQKQWRIAICLGLDFVSLDPLDLWCCHRRARTASSIEDDHLVTALSQLAGKALGVYLSPAHFFGRESVNNLQNAHGLSLWLAPPFGDHLLAMTELDYTPVLKSIVGHERGFVKWPLAPTCRIRGKKQSLPHMWRDLCALAGPTSGHRPVLQQLAQARSLIMKTGGIQRNLQ
jgi:hypothetical protein